MAPALPDRHAALLIFLVKTLRASRIESERYSIILLAMVLTEGVETAEQFQMLREMGCRLFQGYHFAKPLPLAEFEAAFRS